MLTATADWIDEEVDEGFGCSKAKIFVTVHSLEESGRARHLAARYPTGKMQAADRKACFTAIASDTKPVTDMADDDETIEQHGSTEPSIPAAAPLATEHHPGQQ